MKRQDEDARKVTMVRDLAELDSETQPSRDLWPSIAALIARDEKPSRWRLRELMRPLALHWAPWAVMASLGLVVGFWILAPRWTGRPGKSELTADHDALNSDQANLKERDALAAGTPSMIAGLPKEAQASASDSLAAIRKTQIDIQTAIRQDPGNPLLRQLLIGAYQEEIRAMVAIRDANTQYGALQS